MSTHTIKGVTVNADVNRTTNTISAAVDTPVDETTALIVEAIISIGAILLNVIPAITSRHPK